VAIIGRHRLAIGGKGNRRHPVRLFLFVGLELLLGRVGLEGFFLRLGLFFLLGVFLVVLLVLLVFLILSGDIETCADKADGQEGSEQKEQDFGSARHWQGSLGGTEADMLRLSQTRGEGQAASAKNSEFLIARSSFPIAFFAARLPYNSGSPPKLWKQESHAKAQRGIHNS